MKNCSPGRTKCLEAVSDGKERITLGKAAGLEERRTSGHDKEGKRGSFPDRVLSKKAQQPTTYEGGKGGFGLPQYYRKKKSIYN